MNESTGSDDAQCSRSWSKLVIYDFGDQNFLVFEGADRLRTEFRMICHSIYHVKDEVNDTLPMLPLVLLPEQVHVLFDNGFALIRKIKHPESGHSSNLNFKTFKQMKNEDSETRLRELASKIVIGRKLKAQKRARLGPDASSHALKVRKLDHQIYSAEEQQQYASLLNNGMILDVSDSEMHLNENEEMEQTIQELRLRDLEKQKQAGYSVLNYGLPCTSDYEIPISPKFPETADYCIRLTVFRDLWRKGFYLANGTKFGCDYLAYERPPGERHSRFMVVCTDVNNSLQPLNLIGVSRVCTQVKKHILLAIVSPGVLIPYYMEINWWKGTKCCFSLSSNRWWAEKL